MTAQRLVDTAAELLAGDRGILAMDEGVGTCNRRLAAAGIEQTPEIRREYRDMLVTTPGPWESIHGAILVEERFRQLTAASTRHNGPGGRTLRSYCAEHHDVEPATRPGQLRGDQKTVVAG